MSGSQIVHYYNNVTNCTKFCDLRVSLNLTNPVRKRPTVNFFPYEFVKNDRVKTKMTNTIVYLKSAS